MFPPLYRAVKRITILTKKQSEAVLRILLILMLTQSYSLPRHMDAVLQAHGSYK